MQLDEQVRTFMQPSQLSGRQLMLSKTDRYVLAVFASLTCYVWLAYNFLLAALAGLVLGALFWRRRLAMGRNYYVFAKQFVRARTVWRAGDKRPPPYSYQVNVIRGLNGEEVLTLVHTEERGTDTVMVFGSGSRQAALDLTSQERFYDGLTLAIKRASMAQGYSVGISTTFSRRPQDMTKMAEFEAAAIHPGCFAPPKDDDTVEQKRLRRLGENMMEVYQVALEHGSDVDMSMAITVKRTGALQRLSRKGFFGRTAGLQHSESTRLPVLKLATTLATNLRGQGVSDAHVGSYKEILTFLRGAGDIAHLGEYKEIVADIPPGNPPSDEVLEKLDPQPRQEVSRAHDHCTVDGTHHAVVRLTNLPPAVLANFMAQLYASEVPWVRISVVGESVKGRREERLTGISRGLLEGFDEYVGRVQPSKRSLARLEGLEESEKRIFESGWVVTYNVMIDIATTGDPALLTDQVELVIAEAQDLQCDGRQIKGAAWQLPAMWSATTGIPVL